MKYRVYYTAINFPTGRREQHDVVLDLDSPTDLIPRLRHYHGVDIEDTLVIDAIHKSKPRYRANMKFTGYDTIEVEADSEDEAQEAASDKFEAFCRSKPATDLSNVEIDIEHIEDANS